MVTKYVDPIDPDNFGKHNEGYVVRMDRCRTYYSCDHGFVNLQTAQRFATLDDARKEVQRLLACFHCRFSVCLVQVQTVERTRVHVVDDSE